MFDEKSKARWKRDVAMAGGVGAATAVIMAGAVLLIGHVTGSEARVLLESIQPTSRFLCSAVMTACATILALMLTLLGTSLQTEIDLHRSFYHRIKQIAFYDTLALVVSTCFLVVHCIPITKSEGVPSLWYRGAYYTTLIVCASLGGALTMVVCMLYAAVRDVIHGFGLEDDKSLKRISAEQVEEQCKSPADGDEVRASQEEDVSDQADLDQADSARAGQDSAEAQNEDRPEESHPATKKVLQ